MKCVKKEYTECILSQRMNREEDIMNGTAYKRSELLFPIKKNYNFWSKRRQTTFKEYQYGCEEERL